MDTSAQNTPPQQIPQTSVPAVQVPTASIPGKPELEPTTVPELNLEQLRQMEKTVAASQETVAAVETKSAVPIDKELTELGVEHGADEVQDMQDKLLQKAGADFAATVATASGGITLPPDAKPVPMSYAEAVTTARKHRVTESVDWLATMTVRIWRKFNRFLQ